MSLMEIFANPPDEYRPIPWWAWTGKFNPPRMKQQLHLMHAQGIRQFFIFAVYGIEQEYMSDEYLDNIGLVLDWCSELGMKAWIYDDYNWPSGTAAGRVPRHHPEAVAWLLEIERHSGALPSEARTLLADPCIVHACVVMPDGRIEPIGDETHSDQAPLELIIYRPRRDTTRDINVLTSLWCQGDVGMVDALSPSACASFIDEAYNPVAERFSEHFGSTIVGFFTDEPQVMTGNLYAAPTCVPWTPRLPEQFLKRFGYDVTHKIHDLTFDTESSERTRIDFYSLIAQMSSESFTGQIAQWCDKRGLVLTGHMWPEENPGSVFSLGDISCHLRKMHVPGCDLLYLSNSFDNATNPLCGAGPWLIKTPKLAASAARSAGRSRVMCEAFGIGPWSRTIADEKRMADWLIALGVNLINDNTLTSEISGFRKRMFTGKHFTQPWWQHARLFYEYAGGISALCSETTLDTKLAVLFPITTWQSAARIGGDPCELNKLLGPIDSTLDLLVRKHWDFEFLFEDDLAKATVEDGVLRMPHGSYSTVILAGVHRLPEAVSCKLSSFTSAGGSVILVDSSPETMYPTGNRELSIPRCVVLTNSTNSFCRQLDEVLTSTTPRPWVIDGVDADGLISAGRTDGSETALLFISNQTPGAKDLTVRWDGSNVVECWDTSTGCRWTPNQTRGKLCLTLPQDESLWLVQIGGASTSLADLPDHHLRPKSPRAAVVLDGEWRFRPEPANLLRLPCRLRPDDGRDIMTHGSGIQMDESWVDVEWGDSGISLEPEIMDAYWLYSEFRLTENIDDLDLIVDSSDVVMAQVNGTRLVDPKPLSVWDDSNLGWSIVENCQIGLNRVLLKVLSSPYYSQKVAKWPVNTHFTDPVVLRGSFAADTTDQWTPRVSALSGTIEVGDWCTQGFPHFVGTGVYERDFTWTESDSQAVLVCDSGKDVVEILVDGVSLGARAWGPRQFVTGILAPGGHHIEVRITNTLGALLRYSFAADVYHPAPASGLTSAVDIFAMK